MKSGFAGACRCADQKSVRGSHLHQRAASPVAASTMDGVGSRHGRRRIPRARNACNHCAFHPRKAHNAHFPYIEAGISPHFGSPQVGGVVRDSTKPKLCAVWFTLDVSSLLQLLERDWYFTHTKTGFRFARPTPAPCREGEEDALWFDDINASRESLLALNSVPLPAGRGWGWVLAEDTLIPISCLVK